MIRSDIEHALSVSTALASATILEALAWDANGYQSLSILSIIKRVGNSIIMGFINCVGHMQ